jgi:chromosome segregation ATPase
MKSEILENLYAERSEISNMLIDIQPQNDEQKKQCQTLMQRKDRITGAISGIIAAEINEAAADVADGVSELEEKTEELKQLAKTIDNVDTCIKVADAIIQAVTVIL